jgi:hypothetical protein
MALKLTLMISAIYLALVGLALMFAPLEFGVGAVPADASPALLTQHHRTAFIQTYDMERVLADIDTDYGDWVTSCLRHGVLLVFGDPCQLLSRAGQEHGRTIPLADVSRGAVAGSFPKSSCLRSGSA